MSALWSRVDLIVNEYGKTDTVQVNYHHQGDEHVSKSFGLFLYNKLHLMQLFIDHLCAMKFQCALSGACSRQERRHNNG